MNKISRWRWFLGLSLIGISLARGGLEARLGESDWRDVREIGVEGVRVEDHPDWIRLLAAKAWRIETPLADLRERILFGPYYSIRARITDEGRAYNTYVSIGGKQGRDRNALTLQKYWPRSYRDPGLVVFAWLVEGQITQVKTQLWTGKAESESTRPAVDFELSDDERQGQPVVLFWAAGSWQEPEPRFAGKLKTAAQAVMWQEARGLEQLVDAGVNPLGKSRSRETLLTVAAEAGLEKSVEVLLEQIPPDRRSRLSPDLHAPEWAASNGRIRVLETMITRGAAFRDENAWGEQPLLVAVRNGHPDTVRLLAPYGDPDRASYYLALALSQRDVEIADILADVTGATLDERTLAALLYARTRARDHDAMRWLLDRGAKPLVADQITARRFAIDQDRPVQELSLKVPVTVQQKRARAGARAEFKSAGDESPLMVAVRNGDVEAVELLLQHGLDIQVRGKDEATPLWVAARDGAPDMAQRLLEAGAEVSGIGPNGRTVWHEVARMGWPGWSRQLSERGADPLAVDDAGVTPLGEALRNGSLELARELLELAPEALGTTRMEDVMLERILVEDAVDLLAKIARTDTNLLPQLGDQLVKLAELAGAESCRTWLVEQGHQSTGGVTIIPAEDLDRPVLALNEASTNDPRSPRHYHETLMVNVTCLVSPGGEVWLPRIPSSVPGVVRESLFDSLLVWRFETPVRDGQPVWTRVDLPIRYPARAPLEKQSWQVDHVPRYQSSTQRTVTHWGAMLLEFTVQPDGSADDVVVCFAEDLDRAAKEVLDLAYARFTPARLGGKYVPCRWRFRWDPF